MILKDGVWKHCFKEEELQTELHTRKGGTKRLCQRDGEQLSWGAGWELKHKAFSWVAKGGTGVPTEGPAHAKGPVEVETQCGWSSGRGEAGEKDQS